MNRNGLLAGLVAALLLSLASSAAAAPARDIKLPSVTARLDGSLLRVTAKLKLRGKVKPFAVAYRLGDTPLGQRTLRRGKRRQQVTFTLPSGLAPGQYALTACADPKQRIRERNERNNCRSARTPIVIKGRPVPSPPGPKPPVKDRTAPDTTITAGPPAFAFTSSEAGSRFQCRLDGDTFAACTSPHPVGDLAPGEHDFAVRAIDRAGNVDATPATQTWTVAGDGGPGGGPKDPPAPDPEQSAPPLPATGTTSVADATSFLYSGANPVQKGVEDGAIQEARVAVLRGRVLNRMGGGIGGVRVTVLDHPELGRTATRIDGGYDIAVNGGGPVVLRFERAGWIPVQRTVETPWEDYASVDDVVLIPYDDAVTTIDLQSGEDMQVHRATTASDDDGTRRATLMFPEGTHAEMVLPDGSKQPLEQLDVRATEYTVGPNGRDAMPSALPTASGYTYAVELSVDQAVEAGATEVRFDKPVINYVDNFLDFPVGGAVPTGYYDRTQGHWVAAPNGRVIKIDSIVDGKAVLSGATGLAISDAERERLAALYEPGKSLWRVPIEHFTPWDHNWPYAPPEDSVRPPVPVPNQNKPKTNKKECWFPGSVIGCQSQKLGQRIEITGTTHTLQYWSDRTPGYVDENRLNIPLVPNTVPSGLQHVFVKIDVAGQHFERDYEPAANLDNGFVWDGRDAYGRKVLGPTPVTVSIGYQYGLVDYKEPKLAAAAWGRFGTDRIDGARGRMDAVLWSEHRDEVETVVANYDARTQGLGGWTLGEQHTFDEARSTVHLGSGGDISADPVITTVAGNGAEPVIPRQGDGQQGLNVPLGQLGEAEVGPDGTVYFSEVMTRSDGTVVGSVRRLDLDGHVRTLATNLGGAIGLGVAPDGTVYVAEGTQHRVRKISPQGVVTPFAGGGTAVGEGVPATEAKLEFPNDVAVAADGSVYISEYVLGGGGSIDSGRVLVVGTDGNITTAAGGGEPDDGAGDGGPATRAKLAYAAGIALGQNGELLIADRDRIRRVDAGGTITTLAGGGDPDTGNGDGGPATQAEINFATAVAAAPDGGVVFADGGLIRRIAPDGRIHRIAGGGSCGNGSKCDLGDRGPATAAPLQGTNGIAFAPDGSFYVTTAGDEAGSGRIRKVARPLVRQHGGRGVVPSPDGTEAYEFDDEGRHLRTFDALTGQVKLTFAYDGAGRLASVADADGNLTTIERDGTGQPTAIVAPGGQRTKLQVNADGWLERVENPAGEATRFEYKPGGGGLMTKMIDRRQKLHEFTYTGTGRLVTDSDPERGVTTLERTGTDTGYKVTKTSALGRTETFELTRLGAGGIKTVNTDPAGGRTVVVTDADGNQQISYPDGTTAAIQREPDPQWGFSAPMISSYTVTTPGGKTESATLTRTTTLADSSDPLSVLSHKETYKVGAKTTTTAYDAETRTIAMTSPKGRVSKTVLDEQARPQRIEPAPGQDAIVITRDGEGRLQQVDQGTQRWTYEYDDHDRVKARTDAAGKRSEYGYDDADRTTMVKRPGGDVYRFAYDEAGMPKSITLPDGDVHELGHNAVDQLSRFKPAGSTAEQTRTYDRDHALEKIVLPSGRTIEDGRQAATGRPSAETLPDALIKFAYADDTDRASTVTRDPVGAGPDEALAYEYDGDLPKAVTASGTAAGRYEYTYGAGLLMSNVKLVSGSTTLDTAITRDDDGLVTAFGPFTFARTNSDTALKISEGLASIQDMTFDGRGRLATRAVKVGANTQYRVDVTRNARGLVERRVETVGATSTEYLYTYDDDGRLLTVKRDGTPVEQYTYDANGNRRTRQLGAGAVEELGYDAQERLASRGGVNYTFDADGFLSGRGADTFVYSARGELLEATVGGTKVTYTYDGFGRRVSRTVGTATTQYLYGNPADPFQVTAVRDSGGVLTAYYYDESGHLFAMRRGTTRFYVATDQVGTPRAVVATNGTVSKSVAYDTFGNQTADSAPAFELPFGYAGGLADPVTGLVRFGLRDYDPASGRWTARDPALFAGQTANLYEYVGNSPVDQRDPSGLVCIGGSVYAGFGGGGQFCINSDGFSLCAEAGFGVGSDLSADTGGLAEDTESIIAEAGASAGPIGVKVGAEFDNTGCLSLNGPEVRLGESAFAKFKDGSVKFGYKQKLDIKNGPDALLKMGKVKVQAKIAGKFCRKALW